MDDGSDRRPLLMIIAALVLVVVAVLTLTLRQFAGNLDDLVPWLPWMGVAFSAIMLVFTALVIVGRIELRPVLNCFVLVLACKVIATLLTAAGFMWTSPDGTAGNALLDAGLGSLSASVLHVIGALVVARLLRDVVVGAPTAVETQPEGLMLPTLPEPEMAIGGPEPDEELWRAPPERDVDPFKAPVVEHAEPAEPAQEEEPVEEEEPPQGEEELDRIVAAGRPATADLESMPDLAPPHAPAPETPETDSVPVLEEDEPTEVLEPQEPAESPEDQPKEILLSIGDVLKCFKPEDVAMTPTEVAEQRDGDNFVRLPLDVVLSQLDTGTVLVEPGLIFSQLPPGTFNRSAEEITTDLWRAMVELPIERVVAQVPLNAMLRSYKAEQEKADEFPDPFQDTLAAASEETQEPPTELIAEAGVEQAPAAPVQEPEPLVEAVQAPDTQSEETEQTEAAVPTSGMLAISAEYIVAQLPEHSMAIPIDDVEANLGPSGRFQVPFDDALPQLAQGFVAVPVGPLLEQLPASALLMSRSEIEAAMPNGKVELPLDEIINQAPAEALALQAGQKQQAAADEIPEPFEEVGAVSEDETTEEPEPEAVHAAPEPARPAPEPAAPALEQTPLEAVADDEAAVEIPWIELLPQFPADAFSVSREQVMTELEGKTARIGMDIVKPQLAQGHITVACSYLLAQFPSEYLELSIEQVAERLPDARFEIPLPAVIKQLSADEFALPERQAMQESVDDIPTVFVEAPAQETPEPEPVAEPEEALLAQAEQFAEQQEPWTHNDLVEDAAPVSSTQIGEVSVPQQAGAETPADQVEPELVMGPASDRLESEAFGSLTAQDIEQLENMLAEKRGPETGLKDEGMFIDEFFAGEQDRAAGIVSPVLEPKPPARPFVTLPIKEEYEPAPAELDAAFAPPESFTEEPPAVLPEEPGIPSVYEAEAQETAPAEPATDQPGPTVVSLDEAVRDNAGFRDVIAGYSKHHVEHGNAYLTQHGVVFALTPIEINGEELAREVPPRLTALAHLAAQAGCGPPPRHAADRHEREAGSRSGPSASATRHLVSWPALGRAVAPGRVSRTSRRRARATGNGRV